MDVQKHKAAVSKALYQKQREIKKFWDTFQTYKI